MIISNMILLPQIILGYLLFDAFYAAKFAKHLMPMSTFSICTLVIGSLVIFMSFIWLFVHAKNTINQK
jgi:hypothetical protein